MEFNGLLRDVQWHLVENHLDPPSRASLALASQENYATFFDPAMFGNTLFAESLKFGYESLAVYSRDVLQCPTEVALEDIIDEDSTIEQLEVLSRLVKGAISSRRFARKLGSVLTPQNFEKYKSLAFETVGSDDLLKTQFVNGAAMGGFLSHIPTLCPELDAPNYSSNVFGETFFKDNLETLKYVWNLTHLGGIENPSPAAYFEMSALSTREFLHQLYFTWLRNGTRILSWILDGIKSSNRTDKGHILREAIFSERTFASVGSFGNIEALKLLIAYPATLHCVETAGFNKLFQAALLSAISHNQIDFVKFILAENLAHSSNKAQLFYLCSEKMTKPRKWLKMFQVLFDHFGGVILSPNRLLDPFLIVNDPEVYDYLSDDLGFRCHGSDSALLLFMRCLGDRMDPKKKAKEFRLHKDALIWLHNKGYTLDSAPVTEILNIDSILAKNIVMECIKELKNPLAFLDAVTVFGQALLQAADENTVSYLSKYLESGIFVREHVSRLAVLDLIAFLQGQV